MYVYSCFHIYLRVSKCAYTYVYINLSIYLCMFSGESWHYTVTKPDILRSEVERLAFACLYNLVNKRGHINTGINHSWTSERLLSPECK